MTKMRGLKPLAGGGALLLAAFAAPPLALAQEGAQDDGLPPQQFPGEAAPEAEASDEANKRRLCIGLTRIRRTEVIDDQTILFHMKGRQVWKNTLPNRCFGLKFERRFSYATSLTQLCNTDIINVFDNFGFVRSTCGLGVFEDYDEAAEEAAAKAEKAADAAS